MTCREFKHSAAALTLWELGQAQDDSILSHAAGCESCGAWLGKQRSLATSLRTLQTQSAGLEAGPQVERALLGEFRRATATRAATARRFELLPSENARRVMRWSRFFEIGAYAAAAAAIVVGVFLGTQLLHRSPTTPSQIAAAAASVTPAGQVPAVAPPSEVAKTGESHGLEPASVHRRVPRQPAPVARAANIATQPGVTDTSQINVDQGYIALMFCDPLSCSSDSEVVRMEWPAPAGQNAQPQIADVVVGDDGVVRAVRIVN